MVIGLTATRCTGIRCLSFLAMIGLTVLSVYDNLERNCFRYSYRWNSVLISLSNSRTGHFGAVGGGASTGEGAWAVAACFELCVTHGCG